MTGFAGRVSCRVTTDMGESRVIPAENDNGEVDPGRENTLLFQPSWFALFLPTAVIATGYAVALGVLQLLGKGDGAFARLCIVVLALGVPLLLANALLRYFTIHIRFLSDTIIVHPGFPRRNAREIAYPLIRDVRVSQGMSGKLSNSGTLILELVTGQRVAIGDLAEPHKVESAMELRLDDGIESEERTRAAAVR